MTHKSARGDHGTPARDDQLYWLETYFIVFPHQRRPTLAQVEHALAAANPRLKLENLAADEDGTFQSLLVQAPEDHAAVEVSYESGEAVIDQNLEWAKQLQRQLTPKQLQLLASSDARLDVAHYERVQGSSTATTRGTAEEPSAVAACDEFTGSSDAADDDYDEEASLETFDPTCLLTVVETLSRLTRGLAFDPAAGEVV